jgi:hypothetical protein
MTKLANRLLTVACCSIAFTSDGASAAPFLPDFGAATFLSGAPIDHPYFPLLDNLTRIYQGEKEEGGEIIVERFELTVLGLGPTILGVQTTTQRDRAFEDELLVEDTFDYYAQDTAGNVWYFGEDVTNYLYDADDNLIGTTNSSSWLAGVNSGLPGFIMPADLTPAFNYYQEFAPFDAAVDEGTTLASDRDFSIGIGEYMNVLAVLETLAPDPDVRAIKYYAPGIGLIAEEEGLGFDLMDPELTLELIGTVAPVPIPAPFALLSCALAGLFASCRRVS